MLQDAASLSQKILEKLSGYRDMIEMDDISFQHIEDGIGEINALVVKLADSYKTMSKVKTDTDLLDIMIASYPDGQINGSLLTNMLHGHEYYGQLFLVSGAEDDLFEQILDDENRKLFNELKSRKKICSIVLKENLGPSIARNIISHLSQAHYFACIDDDGLTTIDDILKLANTANEFGAEMVRGSVQQFDSSSTQPPHYSKSKVIASSFCDIEGMSVWRTKTVREFQFDPIMFGHEGVELTIRISDKFSPESFLIYPKAILFHDFNKLGTPEKDARHKLMEKYINLKQPNLGSIKKFFYRLLSNYDHWKYIVQRRNVRRQYLTRRTSSKNTLSIITTAFNSEKFVSEYAQAWKRQGDKNFEIIFVDDGSEDATADVALKELNGLNAKVIRSEHVGRGAALNKALENRSSDWCIIADCDDIPVPDRVESTRKIAEIYPDATVIGFNIFDFNSFVRGARPLVLEIQDIAPRFYLGMPTPFPSIFFKAEHFKERFSEDLPSGIDYDWLFRNFIAGAVHGICVPYTVVHYRVHDNQITAKYRNVQMDRSISHTSTLHRKLLDDDTLIENSIRRFLGWESIEQDNEMDELQKYSLRLCESAFERLDYQLAMNLAKLTDTLMRFYRHRLVCSKLGWNRKKHQEFKEIAEKNEARYTLQNAEKMLLERKLNEISAAKNTIESKLSGVYVEKTALENKIKDFETSSKVLKSKLKDADRCISELSTKLDVGNKSIVELERKLLLNRSARISLSEILKHEGL